MSNITGFHHIAFWAKDFDKSVSFYTDALGLKPRYAWGEVGKRAIILQSGEHGHIEIFERPDQDDAPAEARLLHFALQTQHVDELYEAALAAGATSRIEPKDVALDNTVSGGPDQMRVRLAFVNGLDGEIIEFFDDRSAQ